MYYLFIKEKNKNLKIRKIWYCLIKISKVRVHKSYLYKWNIIYRSQ